MYNVSDSATPFVTLVEIATMKTRASKAKWLLLFGMAAPTFSAGCAASIALEALDSAVGGMYLGAQAWGMSLANDFFVSLGEEE